MFYRPRHSRLRNQLRVDDSAMATVRLLLVFFLLLAKDCFDNRFSFLVHPPALLPLPLPATYPPTPFLPQAAVAHMHVKILSPPPNMMLLLSQLSSAILLVLNSIHVTSSRSVVSIHFAVAFRFAIFTVGGATGSKATIGAVGAARGGDIVNRGGSLLGFSRYD